MSPAAAGDAGRPARPTPAEDGDVTDGCDYQVRLNERTRAVFHAPTGRWLGAVGANYYRLWVFPLYTPAGRTVVREFPFDHPFHNGCFVGQHPVLVGGRTGNFWLAPPRRGPDDALFVHVGRMGAAEPDVRLEPHAARFDYRVAWLDERGGPMIDERRTVAFRALADATVCDVISEKVSAHGPAEYPQTKFGSIGIRVEPRLLPALGGEIVADGGRRGRAEVVHEGESSFVAYERPGGGGGDGFGVLMHILAPDADGPWFIRDYGMALYNPTWTRAVAVPAGESWTIGLRVVAYDGAATEDRVAQWLAEGPP